MLGMYSGGFIKDPNHLKFLNLKYNISLLCHMYMGQIKDNSKHCYRQTFINISHGSIKMIIGYSVFSGSAVILDFNQIERHSSKSP